MDTTLAPQVRRVAVRGNELSIREWPGQGRDFLLVHGLASNARTWDLVAAKLNQAGHHVVAVDQRGHGLSNKPETGYSFDDVCTDLTALIEAMSLRTPVIAGQSWGGNVVLELGARWPEVMSGIVMVDGGFIDLSGAPGVTWEQIAVDLKPPPLAGMPRVEPKHAGLAISPLGPDLLILRLYSGNVVGPDLIAAQIPSHPDGTYRLE